MFHTLLRVWLLILALFEVPELHKYLIGGAPFDAFNSNLANADAERRLWGFVLFLLVLARLLGAHSPDVRSVRVHVAAVHVAELVALGGEKVFFARRGEDALLGAIVFNAVLFTAWALQPIKAKTD